MLRQQLARRWAYNETRRVMERNGVVVVGSHVQGFFMRVPRFPVADETVLGWDFKEALDGGKGSHQAIACARLGLPTHFVGRVGRDRLGDTGASWMAEAGVDLSYLFRSEQTATGCGFVMINAEGIPAMSTAMGANADFCNKDIDCAEAIFSHAKLVVITFEIPISTALYAAKLAKSLGAFTILTPGPAEPMQPGELADVDLLVPNENEAGTLLSELPDLQQEPRWLARRLREYFGLKQIVITLGEKGALVVDGETIQVVPALKVNAADTPGAGDAFTAGLAFGLYHKASLVDAANFGCLTAARAVTVRESIPSFGTLAEIAEFAGANRFDIPTGLRDVMDLNRRPTANVRSSKRTNRAFRF
jgi:ribokinase